MGRAACRLAAVVGDARGCFEKRGAHTTRSDGMQHTDADPAAPSAKPYIRTTVPRPGRTLFATLLLMHRLRCQLSYLAQHI